MPYVILGLLALAPISAVALPNPCSGVTCTTPMQAIAETFMKGQHPNRIPKVYSGPCYHLANWYDGNHQHHGYVYLDQKDGSLYMSGAFSFFAQENPYKSIDLEEARRLVGDPFEARRRMTSFDTYAFIDWNAEDPANPWQYWIRQSEQAITVIGQWGTNQRVFCQLEPNP